MTDDMREQIAIQSKDDPILVVPKGRGRESDMYIRRTMDTIKTRMAREKLGPAYDRLTKIIEGSALSPAYTRAANMVYVDHSRGAPTQAESEYQAWCVRKRWEWEAECLKRRLDPDRPRSPILNPKCAAELISDPYVTLRAADKIYRHIKGWALENLVACVKVLEDI